MEYMSVLNHDGIGPSMLYSIQQKESSMEIYHGDVVYSQDREKLVIKENAFILVKDGVVEEVLDSLPSSLKNIPVKDYGRDLIIPAFSDLHVHAPQYMELCRFRRRGLTATSKHKNELPQISKRIYLKIQNENISNLKKELWINTCF